MFEQPAIRTGIMLFLFQFTLSAASIQNDSVFFLRSFGNGGVCSYAYTVDWQAVLVGTHDGKVRLYDLKTGDTVVTYPGSWCSPTITRSSTGKLVAITTEDSAYSISIFEMKTGVLLKQYDNPSRYYHLRFSANDSILHTTNNLRESQIINLSNDSVMYRGTSYKPILSPDGKCLLSTSQDYDTLSYYKISSFYKVGDFPYFDPVWKKRIMDIDSCDFLPDGSIALMGIRDGGLMIVDTADGDTLRRVMKGFSFSHSRVEYRYQECFIPSPSPWNGTIAFQSRNISDSITGVWDLNTDTLVSRIKTRPLLQSILGFTEDGAQIVCSTDRLYGFSFWDAHTGDSTGCLPMPVNSPFEGSCMFPQTLTDNRKILSLLWPNDPASGDPIFLPQIWDANTAALLQTLRKSPSKMLPKLSPDGTRIATSMCPDTIVLRDVATESVVQTFWTGRRGCKDSHLTHTLSFDFKNDGATLFGVLRVDSLPDQSDHNTALKVFWWDVATGKIIKQITTGLADAYMQVYSSWDCSKYLTTEGTRCTLYYAANDSVIGSCGGSYVRAVSSDLSTVLLKNGLEIIVQNGSVRAISSDSIYAAQQSFDKTKYFLQQTGTSYKPFLHVSGRNFPIPTDNLVYNNQVAPPALFSMDGSRLLINYQESPPCLYDISGISTAAATRDPDPGEVSLISPVLVTNRVLRLTVPPGRGNLKLTIYTPAGRLIASYFGAIDRETGVQSFTLPATPATGIYLYRMDAGNVAARGKFIIAR